MTRSECPRIFLLSTLACCVGLYVSGCGDDDDDDATGETDDTADTAGNDDDASGDDDDDDASGDDDDDSSGDDDDVTGDDDDASSDDDDATTGDDDDTSDDDDDDVQFAYESCAPVDDFLQFPTPAWETSAPGATMTGVQFAPPKEGRDKVARLFGRMRQGIWAEQFKDIDGFPLNGAFFVALEGEPADKLVADYVQLYRWKGDTAELFSDFEFAVSVSEDKATLVATPVLPLPVPEEPGERYILAVYKAAVGPSATPLPACDGDAAHEEYVGAAKALVRAGQGVGLMVALPFTPSAMSREIKNRYAALKADSALSVESISERAFDDLGTPGTSSGVDGAEAQVAATKAVTLEPVYSLLLETPAYQDENGWFTYDDATKAPKVNGVTRPGLNVLLPKTGTAPYPTLLFQHCGGCSKDYAARLGAPYLSRGFAIIAIDLPLHGDRSTVPGVPGSDTDFADFNNPRRARDNFRQAALDHLALLTGLDEVNASLKAKTGEEATLDKTRVYYMGHSMGSISGTISTPVSEELSGASLLAGGGSFRQLISDGIFALLITDVTSNRPAIETLVLLSVLQAMVDGGDPLNYPVMLENSALRPKDVLIWEAVGDPVANNVSTENQARAYAAVLVAPKLREETPFDAVPGPVSATFSFKEQTEVASTRALIQLAYESTGLPLHSEPLWSDEVQGITATCFAALAKGQPCIVPKFE